MMRPSIVSDASPVGELDGLDRHLQEGRRIEETSRLLMTVQ
jgi:hypothetical protein